MVIYPIMGYSKLYPMIFIGELSVLCWMTRACDGTPWNILLYPMTRYLFGMYTCLVLKSVGTWTGRCLRMLLFLYRNCVSLSSLPLRNPISLYSPSAIGYFWALYRDGLFFNPSYILMLYKFVRYISSTLYQANPIHGLLSHLRVFHHHRIIVSNKGKSNFS